MNTTEIYNAIETIAATPGKNDKQALVTRHIADLMFEKVCQLAYDPFVVFNVAGKSIEEIEFRLSEILPTAPAGIDDFSTGHLQLLTDLHTRKITGEAAKGAIVSAMAALNRESRELFRRILLKDLRAGFSESTINKAKKGTIPTFPYMRCSLPKDSNIGEADFWAEGAISQLKADGLFVNTNIDDAGNVWLTSRQGSPIPIDQLPGLEDSILTRLKRGTQSHGELVVASDATRKILPREISNGMINSVIKGGALEPGHSVRLMLWDQIPLSAVVPKGKYETKYIDRLMGLIKQLGTATGAVQLVPTRVCRTKEDALAHYRHLLGEGEEGTVLKSALAIWKDGTSKDQVKFKLEVDVDLKIVAINPGRIGTKNEGRPGAFACETSCGGLRTDVTVKNEALRDQVEAKPEDFIGRILPVRANSVMNPSDSSPLYSLFLPRMAEASYRLDKTEADSLDSVKAQFESAVAA